MWDAPAVGAAVLLADGGGGGVHCQGIRSVRR